MPTLSPYLIDARNPYVPVYVPHELLTDVYRLLASASTESEAVTGPEVAAEADPGSDEDNWSGSADERFGDRGFVEMHLAPRSETVREAAKYLAQRPGTWTTSDEIASVLGLEHGWNSLAGAFGAAGRYFTRRDIAMPWDWTYHTPDGRIRLKMEAEIAEVVLAVL